MRSFHKNCIALLLVASPLFAQTTDREQGLLTNSPFWRQALGGSVLSLPSVQAGSAVVALDGGNIKAYSTAGTPMWSYSARGRISPFVSRSREGSSYLSRTNGTLIAVNRAGRELWRRTLDKPLCARVIPGWDGRLFVPTDKKLFCFTASGTLLWSKTFSHSFCVVPRLDSNGFIFFALNNKEVYRIDAFGNTQIWEISVNPKILLSLEKNQIMAVHADGTLEIVGADDNWYLAAESSGHASILPRLPAKPLQAVNRGNNMAAVLDDGSVAFVSVNERKVVWIGDSHIREVSKRGTRPDMEAQMIFDERGVFVLSKNGATCFTTDGKRLWYTLLQNAAAVPAFGNDGVLYSGGRDWILYAYKIEERSLSEAGALFGPAPEGSYKTGTPHASLMPKIPVFDDEIQSMLIDMEKVIDAGRLGSQELAWTSFLLTLCADSSAEIRHRVGALRLLGKIGSRETVPWLINIFRRDNEPLIRAAAAAAIGDIGVDPQGLAIQTFLQALIPDTIKDEQVLLAMTKATADICRFSGPPLSETGIRILNLLNSNNQPGAVRREAQKELASLR